MCVCVFVRACVHVCQHLSFLFARAPVCVRVSVCVSGGCVGRGGGGGGGVPTASTTTAAHPGKPSAVVVRSGYVTSTEVWVVAGGGWRVGVGVGWG